MKLNANASKFPSETTVVVPRSIKISYFYDNN